MTFMKAVWKILPVLLVLSVPVAMFYPLWNNPTAAGEDDLLYYYPLRKMTGQSIRAGEWPVENPLEACGGVIMPDPQSAVMHPTTWLFAVLPAGTAYPLSVFLAYSIAAAGAWVYLRRLGLSGRASALGAAAFAFCGFMVGHRKHLSMINTAAMLPWILWCVEWARTSGRGAFVRAAPVLFVAIAAGHWPTLIQMGVVSGAYFFLRARPLVSSLAWGIGAVALAGVLAAPQIIATAGLLEQCTRRSIGYAIAGENSYFPPAALLFLFPMITGSRTPNFFPQQWWGPWHLCEMLGYVGLVTLVLALCAVRRMYRKPRPGNGDPSALDDAQVSGLRDIVRPWTWICLGVMVWMLGYYLPTYRLIHMIPAIGVVRCPARMMLALDLGLAVLAAVAVHAVAGHGETWPKLRRSIRRGALLILPATMLCAWGLLSVFALFASKYCPGQMPFPMSGGVADALAAVAPSNPALWVPFGVMFATAVAVLVFLRRPESRAPLLVVLLLADLFLISRFVNFPPPGAPAQRPERSPAARWLAENAPDDKPYRVWGLGDYYNDRPAELLLPKTAHALGVSTINSYGPFHTDTHAHLFGFRIFGTTRNWRRLLRRNYLLSLYNVRYILAAGGEYRRVLESVRVPRTPVPADGANLLTGEFDLVGAEMSDGVLRLRSRFFFSQSAATQKVSLKDDTVYKISLEVRGPRGGAAHFLRAQIDQPLYGKVDFDKDPLALLVYAEQIGRRWRRFQRTFRTPPDVPEEVTFRLYTLGERPVEVRNISLRRSSPPSPLLVAPLPPGVRSGDKVYRRVAQLPPLDPRDEPVAIYRNLLCRDEPAEFVPADHRKIESLKWPGEAEAADICRPILDVGVRTGGKFWFKPRLLFIITTVPGVLVYALACILIAGRGKNRTLTGDKT